MLSSKFLILLLALIGFLISPILGREDVWINVPCNKEYIPDNCDFNSSGYNTVDDFDRCGPAKLTINARNYFIAATGRKITYKDNKDAFDRIKIHPKMLRDVSVHSTGTRVLGLEVDFPIGISPVGLHKLAHPEGEKATVAGLSSMRTIMILSTFATTSIEDVAAIAASNKGTPHLWMQLYIFKNRSITVDIVRKAERSGYKALVLTADGPLSASISCNARQAVIFPPGIKTENVDIDEADYDPSVTFKDITWLKGLTRLPIIAKGILSGSDAIRAISAGASAIMVSNHGGRQIDGDPATIDALPCVVQAMNSLLPPREVYMDGGVRSGNDVFKAIARGARMVFFGRPSIWGLAVEGANGVRQVMTTLEKEFEETMLLAGISRVADVGSDSLLPPPSTAILLRSVLTPTLVTKRIHPKGDHVSKEG